jgi:hypothetical protein
VPSRVHVRSGALWALSPDDLCTQFRRHGPQNSEKEQD